jgi:cation diffusion facilitator family transporter
MAGESKKTIYMAVGANLAIAIAKTAGGVLSGSSAMLAEAAHSIADTTNQVFLLISLSLENRAANATHPFGYGKERFFWAFLAAVFIFVSGAVFSVIQGIAELSSSSEESSPLIAYVVLAAAFVAEAISWVRAYRQTKSQAQAAGMPLRRFVRESRDPTVKTVLSEDSAALVGLVLAFAGVGLHQLTGDHRWDAYASILIGVLLAFVAVALGRDTKGLLLGEAALPHERRTLEDTINAHEHVTGVVEVLTMALGPNSLLVAARVDVADGLSGADLERISRDIDDRLKQEVPSVTQVFLDATSRKESGDQ